MFTTRFWAEALERAVKSGAQAVLLIIGADQLNVLSLDPAQVAGFGAGGALLSLLTSVASAPFGPTESPSLVE
jgi:hypothetical protein